MPVPGRFAPLDPDEWEAVVVEQIAPELVGVEITTFRDLAIHVDAWVDGEPHLHPAVAYGLSQALLHATSLVRRLTMAEVIAEEYGMPRPESPVPIFGGCDSRYPINVDRLIIGRADTLPHGGFSSVSMIGEQGEKLIEFVTWMRGRIEKYADAGYRPIVHLDVYGTIGRICDGAALTAWRRTSGNSPRRRRPCDCGSKTRSTAPTQRPAVRRCAASSR